MITIFNSDRITPDELAALAYAAQSLLPNIGAPAHAFDPIARRRWLDVRDAIKIVAEEYQIVECNR